MRGPRRSCRAGRSPVNAESVVVFVPRVTSIERGSLTTLLSRRLVDASGRSRRRHARVMCSAREAQSSTSSNAIALRGMYHENAAF